MTLLKQLGIIVLGCAIGAGMAMMGIWQLDVYHRQGAEASAARAAAAPVPLTSVAAPGTRVTEGYGRAVEFTGSYDPTLQVLVPLEGSSTQFRVVTALRLAGGGTLAVVRGLVPADGGSTGGGEAPTTTTNEITQTGVLLPSEEAGDGMAISGSTPRLPSVRIPQLAQTWPGPMVDGFVVLSASGAQAEGLEPAPLVLPSGQGRLRNGAYAAQWWIFGLFAVVMSVKMARDIGEKTELDSTFIR